MLFRKRRKLLILVKLQVLPNGRLGRVMFLRMEKMLRIALNTRRLRLRMMKRMKIILRNGKEPKTLVPKSLWSSMKMILHSN